MTRRQQQIQSILANLAVAALSGAWTADEVRRRCRECCGRKQRTLWSQSLAERLLYEFPDPPGLQEVGKFISRDAELAAWLRDARRLPRVTLAGLPLVMLPAISEIRRWHLPEILTPGKLAEWLAISLEELKWLADRHAWERRRTSLPSRNYRYRWLRRPGKSPRLLECPKPRLRELQRKIHRELLVRIPPHAAAHGFRAERSVATFAAPHVGREFVARIDLRNFFAQVRRPRIAALFRTLGYPQAVSNTLAALCTNAVPPAVLDEIRPHSSPEAMRNFHLTFGTPHLPQGVPTSPALANLVAHRLDCRLTGLLRIAGGNYTRYADDLVFSGDRKFSRSWPRLKTTILAILIDEGFPIRERKSLAMFRSQRQQVAGLVINESLHLPRDEFDALKACLFNCVRFGPDSQNREAHPDFRSHLQGRIGYLRQFQPARADKLQRLMGRIDWQSNASVNITEK